MGYWRKLSTAPKDGSVIVARVKTAVGVRPLRVKFNDFAGSWTLDYGWNSWTQPIDWMTLGRARRLKLRDPHTNKPAWRE